MATRVAFWNVQRLGANSTGAPAAVLRKLLGYWQADLYVMCELMTTCVNPVPQNLTYRRTSARQLCYGAYDNASNNVVLTSFTPGPTVGYNNAGYKGGSNFRNLADRALASLGPIGNTNVLGYAIHAPASNNAEKVMAYIASYMNATHGGNQSWLVFGDFNVDPVILGNAPIGINVFDLIRRSGTATHDSGSELDYALSNVTNMSVQAMRSNRWDDHSDHSPILIEFD